MYVCIYIYIHTYTCVYIYIYTHTYTHTYIEGAERDDALPGAPSVLADDRGGERPSLSKYNIPIT